MRTLLLVTLLACTVRSIGYAQSFSDSDVRSKIIALENVWNRAAEDKDVDALTSILDDAFVYVDPEGRLFNKAEVLAEAKASQGIRVTSEAIVVHLHGDTAVVTGIYTMKGTERGRLLVRRSRFVDTWRFRNGAWVSIASLATPIVP